MSIPTMQKPSTERVRAAIAIRAMDIGLLPKETPLHIMEEVVDAAPKEIYAEIAEQVTLRQFVFDLASTNSKSATNERLKVLRDAVKREDEYIERKRNMPEGGHPKDVHALRELLTVLRHLRPGISGKQPEIDKLLQEGDSLVATVETIEQLEKAAGGPVPPEALGTYAPREDAYAYPEGEYRPDGGVALSPTVPDEILETFERLSHEYQHGKDHKDCKAVSPERMEELSNILQEDGMRLYGLAKKGGIKSRDGGYLLAGENRAIAVKLIESSFGVMLAFEHLNKA